MFDFLKRKTKVKKFKEKELHFIRNTYYFKDEHPGVVEVFKKYGIVDVWADMRSYPKMPYKRDEVEYINFYYNNGFVIRIYSGLHFANEGYKDGKYYLCVRESEKKRSLDEVQCSMSSEQIKELNEEFSNLLSDCCQYWEKEHRSESDKKEEEFQEKEKVGQKLLDQFMKSRLS